MEAKELMIGDKVMVKVLSQIPDTYVLHTWTANDYSRDIQVKPIPLTAEILEKDGWKRERGDGRVGGEEGKKRKAGIGKEGEKAGQRAAYSLKQEGTICLQFCCVISKKAVGTE